MHGVSVIPAQEAASGQFGVVLVLDASNSMRGDAIEGAMTAARAFADHRQPGELMAIVVFNNNARILLGFTKDPAAIQAALKDAPPLARGTHIYDAVELAVSMLKQAHITVGSIVALSDGADTGSNHSLSDAATAARAAHVRVFSVGLRSPSFQAQSLSQLARSAGGEYSEADNPEDLAPLFDSLGVQLASEYLIRYRSTADANRKVIVAVTVKGHKGAATAGYTTPAVPGEREGPFQRSVFERFVRSAGGMVVTALAAAALIGWGLLLLVRPRRRGFRKRLAEFVTTSEAEEKRNAQARKEQLYAKAERSIESTRWWMQFKEELEVAQISIPAIQIVLWTAAATVIAMYLLSLLAGTAGAFIALVIPFAVRGAIHRRLERERRAFADQLPDNLQVLASALRAGHSLVGALSVVVEDSPNPSKREFQRIIADEQLGIPLEDSFDVVSRRMNSRDIRQVGLVAALQHDTGGNTAEVLDRVADTVRERFELRRLVRTLTAQGRLTRWILSGLPVALLLLITVLNPDYIEPLYSRSSGRVVLAVAAIMIISGSLVIRRIVNIKA
jgi:tight adherence protein B